ncbi:MAG: hypothetical protein H6937_13480 [Burkholderiales bacterium]|nr:hypothetical protein [Burkholderiales bacterium]
MKNKGFYFYLGLSSFSIIRLQPEKMGAYRRVYPKLRNKDAPNALNAKAKAKKKPYSLSPNKTIQKTPFLLSLCISFGVQEQKSFKIKWLNPVFTRE